MTRINIVPPEELTDQHLMREYQELPRILGLVRKALAKGKTPADFNLTLPLITYWVLGMLPSFMIS